MNWINCGIVHWRPGARKRSVESCTRRLPPGFIKTDDGRVEKDPDRRIHHVIGLLFEKTLELGSARQAALWMLEHELDIPAQYHDGIRWKTVWRRPSSGGIVRLLRNPTYAGAYVYGRRRIVMQIEDGIPKKLFPLGPRIPGVLARLKQT